MHHGMRHVEEERLVLVLFNKPHRALGELGGDLFLILAGDLGVDDLVAFDQRQVRPFLEAFGHGQMAHAWMVGPHIVGVRDTEVFIESML